MQDSKPFCEGFGDRPATEIGSAATGRLRRVGRVGAHRAGEWRENLALNVRSIWPYVWAWQRAIIEQI